MLLSQDYNWWWRSMLTSGSSGLYLFLYGIFYYSTKVCPRIRMPNRTPRRLPGWADRSAARSSTSWGSPRGSCTLGTCSWPRTRSPSARAPSASSRASSLSACAARPRASIMLCVRATTRWAPADPLTSGGVRLCAVVVAPPHAGDLRLHQSAQNFNLLPGFFPFSCSYGSVSLQVD